MSTYSPASCLENAHCGPEPSVPGLNATVGREPLFVHSAAGIATVPVTTFRAPLASVET
ncbi:hypothetical protein LUX57_15795 [Actinomadura madurae]|uniref:hypothetical protein n=1 Tax=Actinomadura madurae TaxID=1993 RepID=UPI0020D1FB18|nr:hypothetical protein [Actinomadura madurae]MCP9966381.1 hypothetical protein [Actinomadura madurae]